MHDDRFSRLKPPALIATVGSLRRRFGEVFVPTPDSDPDDVAAYRGPDGRSVLDHLASATAVLSSGSEAINVAAHRDDAVVDVPAAVSVAATVDRAGELDRLEVETQGLAATLSALSGDDWGRSVTIERSDQATIQQLAQATVRPAIELLEAATALAAQRS